MSSSGVRLSRRAYLGWAAAAGVGWAAPAQAKPKPSALADSPHYEIREVRLPHASGVAERFVMLSPRQRDTRVPLLLALHGLGETGDQRTGAHAGLERYGLGSSYQRLLTPPVKSLSSRYRHWQKKRLAEVNQMLSGQPFKGLCIVCPYTPNVYKARSRKQTFDRYTHWLTQQVIPYVRKHAFVYQDARHTYLDGCSLGGYVGIEVFLRAPEQFCAWGAVQGALGAHRINGYAERLANIVKKHGKRFIHLETSSADPFRTLNENLSNQLTKRGIEHDFVMPPGPHNQPFLRDSGTLEMLLWHDRLPRA